ncbi:Aldehyde/histidinol dehydrogenase [Suillus lakei]|nr:Aldehyde/histidinol dehydrogenase [Suillus lakei]
MPQQLILSDHARYLYTYHEADGSTVASAIDDDLSAKAEWEALPWNDYDALGQGKNAWRAEAGVATELSDFFLFGVTHVKELYASWLPKNSAGSWNRVKSRALEGFVLAVSPSNFTAIGGNIPGAPALVGNTVVWKPSPAVTFCNYLVYQIFVEAGVIQFVPGSPPEVVVPAISHPSFTALHLTGIFNKVWKDIAANPNKYKGYPRIVGETGGKNFHACRPQGGFEYQGQRCSASSRLCVSPSLWSPGFKDLLMSRGWEDQSRPPSDFSNFMGSATGRPTYDKVMGFIQKAKDAGGEVLIGGIGDDLQGYFIQPTITLTKDAGSITMKEEIFRPVIAVMVVLRNAARCTNTFSGLSGRSLQHALPDSFLFRFAADRKVLLTATNKLRNAAGNVYYNEKCTGAVVGQEPFRGV